MEQSCPEQWTHITPASLVKLGASIRGITQQAIHDPQVRSGTNPSSDISPISSIQHADQSLAPSILTERQPQLKATTRRKTTCMPVNHAIGPINATEKGINNERARVHDHSLPPRHGRLYDAGQSCKSAGRIHGEPEVDVRPDL
jgi:hypothetical protein